MKSRNLILLTAALGLAACGTPTGDAAPVKESQVEKAQAAADSLVFTENAEIENIKRRLSLTSKPGAIGYIVLLNEAGQPILYTSVKGKITSSGKRLTPPIKEWSIQGDSTAVQGALGDAASDEGTWGSSDPYVYFWDTNGSYHQWSGRYLYSDKPIRLRTEPLVVNIGG